MSVVYEAAMKKIIFLMLLVFSITGCKDSSSEKTDTDINLEPDITTETEEEVDETYIDEDADELVDDENYCPELSKADFPYYDKDGNYTFCRKCDTPTEKDPQCMKNLWEQSEKKLLRWAPENTCASLPCFMDNLKPRTKEEIEKEWEGTEYYDIMPVLHKCDLKINPEGYYFDATHGGIQHWNMSNGKIGFKGVPISSGLCTIDNCPSQRKLIEYDIKTQKYKFIIPSSDEMLSYKNGKAITLSGDYRTFDKYANTGYLTYVSSEGERQVVLNQQVNQILYDPEINENWAAVNWNANKKGLFYAKTGEWDWHQLKSYADEEGGYYPSLADNYLGAVDYNVNAYICDLSKYPESFSDCYQLNQEVSETGNDPVFDSEDSSRMVFYSTKGAVKKIKLVTNINGVWKQSDLITEFTEEFADGYSLVPYAFKGNLLMYNEVKSAYVARPCFYRLDTKEKICMKGMVHPATGETVYPYGFGEFEDKYYLYQEIGSDPFILRDMECYCKEEGICLLSDESEIDDSDVVNDESVK